MATFCSRNLRPNLRIRPLFFACLCGILATPLEHAIGQAAPAHTSDSSEKLLRFRSRGHDWLPEARARWIESQGLQKNFLAIRALIDSASTDLDEEYRDRFAQDLAALYSMDEISRMKARGIDVVRAHPGRPYLNETIDLFVDRTDVMLIGEVIAHDSIAYDDDEYASTITVLVHEVIKGDPTLDTIRIRQFSGKFGKAGRDVTSDFTPIRHTRHLFQVSHRLYPLFTVTRGGTPLNSPRPLYVLQTAPREFSKDETLEHPKACLYPALTPHSLKDLRASAARYRVK